MFITIKGIMNHALTINRMIKDKINQKKKHFVEVRTWNIRAVKCIRKVA